MKNFPRIDFFYRCKHCRRRYDSSGKSNNAIVAVSGKSWACAKKKFPMKVKVKRKA